MQKFCTTKLSAQALKELSMNVFVNSKSVVSFSKYLPQSTWPLSFPNCYLHEDVASKMQIQSPQAQNEGNAADKVFENLGVFRIIINTGIGNQQITTDINTLKKNAVLKQIFTMQNNSKYRTQVSNVIIDDKIQPTMQQRATIDDYIAKVQRNMKEVQKMIEVGLELNYAYMISEKNYECSEWVKILNKKRKAIHSNIVLRQQKNKFEEIAFNEGYKLEHVFLEGYRKNGGKIEVCEKLEDSTEYSVQELANVLRMIDFNGKIVLQDNQYFEQNLVYLQSVFKKNGFSSKSLDDGNWMAVL